MGGAPPIKMQSWLKWFEKSERSRALMNLSPELFYICVQVQFRPFELFEL